MNSRHKPVSFVAAAATILMAIMLYDIMGAIIKHLSQHYPSQQLSMLRNVFGLIPTLAILFWSQSWVQAGRPMVIRQWKFALARGGLGAFAQISFYLALFHLEFATATTIVFAGPLFITALSIPLLGHRVGLWRWLAVLIGFTGVLLVMRPTADSFTWHAILPLCAAFGYASISVTAQLFDKAVPTALINLYYNVGSLVGAVALVLLTGGFVQIGALEDWLWIAAMGIAGGTAAYCLITAYRLAEPSSLSPFEYFGIPFSFCLGWIFFSETPFDRLIPGAFLIVGGGLFIIWREHSLKKTTAD
ncbi:DMT family transporter [Pelagibius sp. Alg239-R121]|uniref:DMT family transporter n=1 Tax=Pelagibius sp. Alg239-R121 TaxID=2993448 RepID=UPI0024A6747D|nr:DMT family transporter [Pelagibius sp. Alg239-R121]